MKAEDIRSVPATDKIFSRHDLEEARKEGYKHGIADREGDSDEEYKAGKQAGIREVVEYIDDKFGYDGLTEHLSYVYNLGKPN